MTISSLNITYHRFDHTFLKLNPDIFLELSKLHCEIGSYDDSQGEFCLSSKDTTFFMDEDLLTHSLSYDQQFYGAYAYDNQNNLVVGITWGFLESWDNVEDKWGSVNFPLLYDGNQSGIVYFSKLAVDKNYRQQGIGSRLIALFSSWAKLNYPNLAGFLRTHSDSKVCRLVDRVGFKFLTDDTLHGKNLILMEVTTCSQLTPENLDPK